ncbi:MAG: response regulator transcription factor [Bacteroidales bacterium]|jgi:DNA-binding response OmpR family regulator|nr:response regulator transcription factor [Bacteroidales bacterium]
MKTRATIYYVEDEPSLGRIVCDTLKKEGYEVTWETDGAKVITGLKVARPDVCVLDIMLPGVDGLSICRTIRGIYPRMPVIFLTARTSTEQVVEGFEAGGTDYLRKPFSISELVARIENQLRLAGDTGNKSAAREIISIGSFMLDTEKYELSSDLSVTKLSNRDMQILTMLYANRNGVTARRDILMTVWGDDSYFNSRTLDVYIRKLRRIFSEDDKIRIITLKNNGYLFITD